jgi:hypothetical protein
MTDTSGALERMNRLADEQEIHDVLMRYCRAVDRLDEELLRSCYHVDSFDDHGHFTGTGHEFAAFIVQSLAARAHHTTHSVGNVLIEIDPGDPAWAHSEAYGLAYLRRTDDDRNEWLDFFSGRYVDDMAKRDGIWRIARRVVVHDWSMSTPLDADSFPLPMDNFTQGRRDRDDLVYRDWPS